MRSNGRAAALVAFSAALALPLPAAARDWVEARSPAFVVVGDASESSIRDVALELERISQLVAHVTDSRLNPTRPVLVFAVRSESSLRSLLPWYWEGKRARPAGVFMGGYDRLDVVCRTDVPFRYRSDIVYHEYLHLVLRQNSTHLPLWLQEGLASFFQTAEREGGRIVVGRLDPDSLEQLSGRELLPVQRLLSANVTAPEYTDRRLTHVFYAQSALLTHYLLLGPESAPDARAPITRLLSRPGDEVAVFPALADPSALDRSLRTYLRTVQRVSRARVFSVDEVAVPVSVRRVSEAESLVLRGDFLVRRGRLEGEDLLDEALGVDSHLAPALEAKGRARYARGRDKEAVASLRRAVEAAPSSASGWFWLGIVSPRTSPAREEALRRAVSLAPSFAPARERLAETLRERGTDLAGAVEMARSAVALEPGVLPHQLTLDAALVAAGRDEEAATVEASLEREALADTLALRQLSRHYYDRTRRPAKADALLMRAVESHPDDPDVMDARARHLWSEKQYEEAERLLRAALEARPASADLMNSLSFMNAERGVKLEEALALIDRALEQSPNYATYLDSKGWVLYRLGRLDGAWTYLARAVALSEDPEILDHLGDVDMARGRTSEAREAWRLALEHDDAKDDLRARVRKKLEGPATSPSP